MGGTSAHRHERRGSFQQARCELWLWVVVFLLCGLASGAQGQEPTPQRVLLISTGSRLAPGFILTDQQILQALAAAPSLRVETYAENIDIVRFPAERSQYIFGEYLGAKYADFPPDLIILVFVGNLGITGKILTQLFPDTPIVVAGYTEEEFRPHQFGKLVSGLAQRVDAEGTLRLMLRVQPELRRIVVIGGTAEVDAQMLDRVEQAAQALKDRVDFEFWRDRSIADVRRAVTALPPDTAVLFTRMFRDAAGEALVSADVGRWIGQSANAPVYALSDTSLGTGAVGGAVASAEAFGRRAGELARRILTGTPPASLPFEVRTESVPMFDWRALQRWGISESRLPPDSVVRFKPTSMWTQYRPYIVAALLVILVQSATIVALILQRRHLRRMQASLQESQQFIDLATTAGRLGLWSRDLVTEQIWANAAMRSLFGFGPHETLRVDDMLARIHADDRARVLADVERAETAGVPFEAEYRVRLPDGTERWLLSKGGTMPDLRGRGTRRFGAVWDITEEKKSEQERKRAEESVREQRAFLRQVIDVNPNLIFAKDREGRFTLANQAVADAYGTTVDDLIGRTDADFNRHAEETRFFRRVDLEVMNSVHERFIPEERITDARGNVRWLQTVKRPIVGPDGSANQVLGTSTDITQRKNTELELQKQRAELAHVARVAVLGQLSASLAHELNQPLTAILTNAQAGIRLMHHEPPPLDEITAILKDITQANTRAAEIIRGIRSFLRKEEEPEFGTLDVPSLVCDVVTLVHSDAIMQDVRVSLDFDENLPPVRGDRVQLQQVVLNLLLNAFDAVKQCAPGERNIKLNAHRGPDGTTVCIAVSDSGPGLTDEARGRIFQPFYTTKREGLGMGLPICRSIVEAHGGVLWVENNAERGVTFYFTVPTDRTAPVSTW